MTPSVCPTLRPIHAQVEERQQIEACDAFVIGRGTDHARHRADTLTTGDRDSYTDKLRPFRRFPSMIGTTVGKYRIVDKLGRGGMGTVYKAVDETLDREVAIKVLNADLNDPDVPKRFRAEAITLARLNHPGIATIYELHQHDDELLMVMEFVRGETLHDLSSASVRSRRRRPRTSCMQVLEALGARAPHRRRASRPEAREPDDHRDRRGQDHGLRHRARARHRAPHARRLHDGHARLHGARTGARPRNRRPRRPLRDGRRPLSPALGPAAVQGRHGDRDGRRCRSPRRRRRSSPSGPSCRRGAPRSSIARSQSRPSIAFRAPKSSAPF